MQKWRKCPLYLLKKKLNIVSPNEILKKNKNITLIYFWCFELCCCLFSYSQENSHCKNRGYTIHISIKYMYNNIYNSGKKTESTYIHSWENIHPPYPFQPLLTLAYDSNQSWNHLFSEGLGHPGLCGLYPPPSPQPIWWW